MSHYFETPPEDLDRPGRYLLRVGDRAVTIDTQAGVFSSRRLDAGTGHLVAHVVARPEDLLEGLPTGVIVDLGCGSGPLSVAAGILCPERTVIGVDVNERAVNLTAANAERAGLANVEARRIQPEDPPSMVLDGRPVAAVVSNPPVRIGKQAQRRLLKLWLETLAPGGRMLMVVSRHLGADSLSSWLSEEGARVRRLGSKSGYRILRVDKI